MRDKLIGFIERHRVLSFIILIFAVIFIILLALRFYNKSKKVDEGANKQEKVAQSQDKATFSDNTTGVTQTPKVTAEPYLSGLSISAQQKKKQEEDEARRKAELEAQQKKEAEEARLEEAIRNQKPTYGDAVICWDTDGVPETMVDGSSLKNYFSSVSYNDFKGNWGSGLSTKDKTTKKLILVGVDQNPNDFIKGYSNQSLGWLISNLSKLDDNTCIKFTDLNTIGSLDKGHVALLCSYDWYSAYGLSNTIVYFEDISKSLNPSDFYSGTVFSAYVYKHNIKVKQVNGQNVVCIQYSKFN